MTTPLTCPACGARLAEDPTPLRCHRCSWRLIAIAEWRSLPPFEQGYLHYMQAAWPTSPLADATNYHDQGSAAWRAFHDGAARAARDVQDGEE